MIRIPEHNMPFSAFGDTPLDPDKPLVEVEEPVEDFALYNEAKFSIENFRDELDLIDIDNFGRVFFTEPLPLPPMRAGVHRTSCGKITYQKLPKEYENILGVCP